MSTCAVINSGTQVVVKSHWTSSWMRLISVLSAENAHLISPKAEPVVRNLLMFENQPQQIYHFQFVQPAPRKMYSARLETGYFFICFHDETHQQYKYGANLLPNGVRLAFLLFQISAFQQIYVGIRYWLRIQIEMCFSLRCGGSICRNVCEVQTQICPNSFLYSIRSPLEISAFHSDNQKMIFYQQRQKN